tara:strand:- start:4939 stop:5433 length:495 start_codon:yes stop_codon:yes gene_type:complete
MAGEAAFAKFCGQEPDTELRPGGDKGVDFTIPLNFTVDVKTACRPLGILHEEGKPFADIFVLAGYEGDGVATLVGWAWGTELKTTTPRNFGHDLINHNISATKLKPMDGMAERLDMSKINLRKKITQKILKTQELMFGTGGSMRQSLEERVATLREIMELISDG